MVDVCVPVHCTYLQLYFRMNSQNYSLRYMTRVFFAPRLDPVARHMIHEPAIIFNNRVINSFHEME